MRDTISPFPYYGGKARMAEFIAERLDYDNTSIYVEPYGGAARVLLNKPRHNTEIYSDYSTYLTTFFEVMADEEKTEELIALLLDEFNPPTEEMFNKAFYERTLIDDTDNTHLIIITKKIIRKHSKKTDSPVQKKYFNMFRNAVKIKDYELIIQCLEALLKMEYVTEKADIKEIEDMIYCFQEYWDMVKETYTKATEAYYLEDDTEDFKNYMKKFEGNEKKYKAELEKREHEIGIQAIENATSDMIGDDRREILEDTGKVRVAAYVFILHYCSRDGMGTYWSNAKNESRKRYENAVINLRRVSERMQGVQIGNLFAENFLDSFLTEADAMIYLDPSYLSPREINSNEESSAEEKESKDLGGVYKMHYGVDGHESLLNKITAPEVKAKIMISNYDVDIYNEMLADWNKYEFETVTTVGEKASKRIECIWTNY